MKSIFYMYLCLLFATVACTSQDTADDKGNSNKSIPEPDGGPCSYDTDTLYCRILEVDTTLDVPQVRAVAYSTLSSNIDTTFLNFYDILNDETSIEEMLAAPHFVVLQILQITSGSCNPYMVNTIEYPMRETEFKRRFPSIKISIEP